MSKMFSNILFSLILLLLNSAVADEHETNGTQPEVIQEQQKVKETPKVQEPKEELSEAQKEAIAAEEAELREAGMEPEPLPE
ncbi:hypothetical protein MN086_09415 [Sulfurovum sp. XGS-02]|uniref:hypothetical protein n=1 Tax=Sulfurovum sp. XGS-02 TaxID=2925411 RepID=UPI00205F7200|nr:hypothetical protein [Sulfurovum sp. XGS-02]UPT77265.1 hypothetical protein MN086_09415 [Sulfurovum sp. XGS-02]